MFVDTIRGRIIPAYAGSTKETPRRFTPGGGSSPHTRGAPRRPTHDRRYRADHPRIRGEHQLALMKPGDLVWIIPAYAGSTRGAAEWRRRHHWIIPAYAGSTDCGVMVVAGTEDHPRIRGEHYGRFRRAAAQPGSSPHTRGALLQSGEVVAFGRIIPAYAGSTCCTL